MKKITAILLAAVMALGIVACGTTPAQTTAQATEAATTAGQQTEAATTAAPAEGGKTIGFVTFGLGGDFFQMLADAYVEKMEGAGWTASYVDGEFNPETQIAAMENYIALGVDAILVWAVAPEALANTVKEAMDKGIKVIAFVGDLPEADAWMISDDAVLADYLCKLSAKWIDETFASAEDHSVPVAVFSCRTAETGVLQADELIKIEEFSKKAKFTKEVELQDELAETGMSAAENLYVTNPEIKVFLSAHNGLAMGINNYFTGVGSPVTDYSDMGIFCVNGDTSVAEEIKASTEGKSPFRGMVLTGGVDDTAEEILDEVTGVMDGTYPKGHRRMANNIFVYADTVDEYLATNTVVSVTQADFD